MARIYSPVHSALLVSRLAAAALVSPLRAAALVAGLAASACVAAGPYGYARSYMMLDAEKAAANGAADYDPVMVARTPRTWRGKKVSAFGQVESMRQLPDGHTEVLLSLRTLQPRNLCENDDQATCRVTISDAAFGTVFAQLALLPENSTGEGRMAVGSLVRVLGTIDPKPHTETGNTVIATQYYRHWPLKTFVTTAARSYMLR